VVDVGEDFVVLSWQRPDRDGGGRLRGYLVEKRDEGTDIWQRCTQTPSPSTSLAVTNLIDGRRYNFRVVSVNDAGESMAASLDAYQFQPGDKGRPPELVRPLGDQFGNVKDVVTFECEFAGQPRPEIQWFKGGFPMIFLSSIHHPSFIWHAYFPSGEYCHNFFYSTMLSSKCLPAWKSLSLGRDPISQRRNSFQTRIIDLFVEFQYYLKGGIGNLSRLQNFHVLYVSRTFIYYLFILPIHPLC
jgi:hypothetical protein